MLEWLPTCSEELIAPLSIITRARSLSLVRALYLITNLKIALLITDTDTIILNNHRRYCSAPFDIRLFDGSALGLCESNLNSITLGHTRNMASRMRKTGTKKAALFAKSTAPALELHDIRSAEKVNFGGFLCLARGFPESTCDRNCSDCYIGSYEPLWPRLDRISVGVMYVRAGRLFSTYRLPLFGIKLITNFVATATASMECEMPRCASLFAIQVFFDLLDPTFRRQYDQASPYKSDSH